MSSILAQTFVEMPRGNPASLVIIIVLAAAVVVGIVVFGARRGGGGATPAGRSGVFSRGRFRRLAAEYGLNPVQSKTLENLIHKYPVPNPYVLFVNGDALDTLLQRALSEIEQQSQAPDVKEGHKLTLYRIKQAIEANSQKRALRGSSDVVAGQEVTLTGPSGTRYPSSVRAVLKDHLAVEVPVDDDGVQIRWKPWTSIQVFLYRPNGQGFSFETKVGGYNQVRGLECLLLKHSNAVQQAAQRRFRRKSVEKACYFYAVQVMTVGSGRDQRKRAVPQTKGALGTVLDVSAGGCSVKSSFPLAQGALIKLEFETEKNHPVTVYGKVKHIRKAQPVGGVMHIQFTQVSRQNLNQINSYVYELG